MRSLLNNGRSMVAVAIVLAVLAVVVPTCQMVGCSMSVGSTMPWGHQPTVGLFGDCGGTYVINIAPNAVVPVGTDPLAITLMTAVLAAGVLFAPQPRVRLVRIGAAMPPPPPENPLGMRLTI